MQKNLVAGVNAALAAERTQKHKPRPPSDTLRPHVTKLEEDIAQLKDENSKFAEVVDEIKKENEELKNKIDQLLAANPSKPAAKKKRSSKKKAEKL